MTDRPRIAATAEELLAGATEVVRVHPGDARSGADFWTLSIDGERCFAKSLTYSQDWIMRVTGDTVGRPFIVWEAGLYHRVPAEIDHAMLGMAREGTGPDARLTMLMSDRADALVPEGDTPLDDDQHAAFMDHMAAFHAAFWGWHDTLGLTTMAQRLRFFAPEVIAPELAAFRRDQQEPPGPLRVAEEGWARLQSLHPGLAALTSRLHADPEMVNRPLAETPSTFVAGDWKMGNLGSTADGRTVLLDWAYPGEAPGCWELAWYLALNRARIPISKEESIDLYRSGLERRGVDTSGWWERQLDLSLLSIAATFAWEKAVGDPGELAWWADRADRATRWIT